MRIRQVIGKEALEFSREGWIVLQQAIGANVVRERRAKQKKMMRLKQLEEVESVSEVDVVENDVAVQSKQEREVEDEELLIDTVEVKQLRAKHVTPKKPVLCLKVICARDLEAMDLGGTSDPYVSIAVGDHKMQSSIVKKSLSPVWDEDFHTVVHDWSVPLKVSVWDYDTMSVDDVIGEATIWLEDIVQDIRRDGSKDLHSRAYLSITVVRAKNLIAADRGGTSDPYISVHVGSKPSSGRKTMVKNKTLNPVWNQTFRFDIGEYERKEVLTIECFDKDSFGKDDSLGKFHIELASLPLQDELGLPASQWHSFDKHKGIVNSGQVELQYQLVRSEDQSDSRPVRRPVEAEAAIAYSSSSTRSSSSNDLLDQIDSNHDGVVDEDEFQRYLASNPSVRPSSNMVRISGMMLHMKGQVVRPYRGINGDYQLSNRVVNFRQVYLRVRQGTVPGGTAMWWANNSGKLCWVIGPEESIGSERIWAYVESTHASPEHSHGAWHVYSYDSHSYELQHDVHTHSLHERAMSPPEASAGFEDAAVSLASPKATPPATPPPQFARADEASSPAGTNEIRAPAASATKASEELSTLQARYADLEARLHAKNVDPNAVCTEEQAQLEATKRKMIELHQNVVQKSVTWFPLMRDKKIRGEIQLGFSFMDCGESTACIDLELDRSHHVTNVSAPTSSPTWEEESFKMVVDSDWSRLRCTLLHVDPAEKPKHILVVTVHRARKLLAMDGALFGAGSSDPYVIVKLGHETKKTEIITKNLSPVWDETFQIPIWGDPEQELHISVWDYDAMSADDTIGEVRVPIPSSSLHTPLRKWFDITGDGKTTGQVELGLRVQEPLAHDIRLAAVIKVVGARDLEAMDVGGSSDPYAVLKLASQEHKTKIIPKNLSPVWNEEFVLSIPEIYQPVEVSVWDHDFIGQDDMIGAAKVHLAEFVGKKRTQQWFDLKIGGRVQGQVLLSIFMTENR